MADSVFRFHRAELRTATRELLVDGQPSPVGARAFDLLQALVTRRERMVSKAELLDIVWPGLVVEENNLPVQIGALRRLLGPKAIVTVPGRGYRFAAELEAEPMTTVGGARPAATEATPAAAAPRATRALAGNLTASLPPLWGREGDLLVVQALVREHRLVSVLGAGGIGKTSLARAAAQQMAHRFPEGVWMVPLADVSDAAALPTAIARALEINLPLGGDPAAELAERLPGRQLLLLDNCEHLAWAVAAVVERLLRTQPDLRVLATSQEPLHLANEHQLRLGALSVPPADALDGADTHGAVALFAARVRALQPAFKLDADALPHVVAICRALDGVPLALEFAAARVPLLGVSGVREHLGQRLRLLRSGARDVPPRHRTLRTTMDWSHALLGSTEQKVFRRLGVFVGGFGLELAQEVARDAETDGWDVLDLLGNLVEKSMVVVEPGAVPRYRLLETARVYACELLDTQGEWRAMQRAHAQGMVTVFDRRACIARYGHVPMDDWVLARQSETDNLRSAIDWAADAGERALALELVNLAADFMYQAGRYTECVAWMRRAQPLIDADTPAPVVARFQLGLATVGLHGGLPGPERLQLLEQAQDILEREPPQPMLVQCVCVRAYVAGICGQLALARRSLERAHALTRLPQLARLRGIALYIEGMVCRYEGRYEEALDAFLQAMAPVQQMGDGRTLFYLYNNLGAVQHELGHLNASAAQYRATLALLDQSPRTDAQMIAFVRHWFAHALTALGRLDEALAEVRTSLPYCRRTVGLRHFAGSLALLAAHRGRLREAALLLGCDDAARARRGEARTPLEQRTLADTLALVGAAHPPERIAVWRLEGTALDDEEAQALVLG